MKNRRVNTFLHVNHTVEAPRYGVLLCVNGTGSLNSWLRNTLLQGNISYPEINHLAAQAPVGSDGLICLPFGNGAERMLENQDPGANFRGLQFSRHGISHWTRAAQEGIVFALYYGMEVMETLGRFIKKYQSWRSKYVFESTFSVKLLRMFPAQRLNFSIRTALRAQPAQLDWDLVITKIVTKRLPD